MLKRILALGITFEFTDSAKDFLSEKGYDPLFGARPLRRAVQRFIEDPISEDILKGRFKEGSQIKVKHKEGADELYFDDAKEDEAHIVEESERAPATGE